MTVADVWLLIGALLALSIGAVLSAAETAVSRLSPSGVAELRREGHPRASGMVVLVADRPRYVNTLLFCHNALMVLAVALVLAVVGGRDGPALAVFGTVLAMALLTFTIAVGARTLGRQHAYGVAGTLAGLIRALAAFLSPVTRVLIVLGNAFTPGKGYKEGPFATQAELRELVDAAEAADLIEHDEREMIHSVFELGDTIAREVMVPRTEMVTIERDRTLRQAISLSLRSGISRIPVVGANADEVLGVVYLKDVSRRVFEHRESESSERVESVMRAAYFVPDSKNIDDLLRQMQADRVHMAVVVDEFGGTAGLLTIEDILEEIVGEIADEYDTSGPEVEPLPSGGWRLSARLPLEDLASLTGIEFNGETDNVETVAGLIAMRLGKVPIPGATVQEQGWELVAESAAGRRHRIGTVLCRPLVQPSAGEREEGRNG